MEHRRARFLPLMLFFLSACALACTGPAPTAAPPFFKFLDRIDLLAIAPDGTVWVTYYGWSDGISHFVAADGSKPWTTYTENDGLPSKAVTTIAAAPDGALWVGTETGTVSRFDGRTWTTWTVQEIGAR